MGGSTRVAPQSFTVEIPANHPALFCLGGEAYQEAAGDLVGRTRKAAAVALITDPATRILMDRYHAALSTVRGPGELLDELRARGVTEFHGTDYGDPGKPLPTLLRECADAIDRAEASRRQAPAPKDETPDGPAANVLSATRNRRAARKAPILSSTELQRQPGFKLPIKGGKVRPSPAEERSDLPVTDTQLGSIRLKART